MADVLKVAHNSVTDPAGEKLIDGAGGDYVYTVLSISLCNVHASNDETFSIWINDDDGGTLRYIYDTQSLPAHSTFIHSDKIVLLASDSLNIGSPSASATIDVVVSYLEQS